MLNVIVIRVGRFACSPQSQIRSGVGGLPIGKWTSVTGVLPFERCNMIPGDVFHPRFGFGLFIYERVITSCPPRFRVADNAFSREPCS